MTGGTHFGTRSSFSFLPPYCSPLRGARFDLKLSKLLSFDGVSF